MADIVDDLFVFKGSLGQYPATVYTHPSGRKTEITVRNIYAEDASWMVENQVELSMEEIPVETYVLYFGHEKLVDDEGTPNEEIVLVKLGEKCEDAIRRGVECLKKRLVAGE